MLSKRANGTMKGGLAAVLIFCLIPLSAMAEVSSCFATGLRLPYSDNPTKPVAFRYNDYVVETLGQTRTGYHKTISRWSRARPDIADLARERLAVLDAHLEGVPDQRRSRIRRKRMVANAPIWHDPYHECDSGNFQIIEGERVIMSHSDGTIIRAIGNFCEAPAKVTFETGITLGHYDLKRIFDSHLASGKTLDDTYLRQSQKLLQSSPIERLILELAAVSQAQCGRAFQRLDMKIHFESVGNIPSIMGKAIQGSAANSFVATVVNTEGGYRMGFEGSENAFRAVQLDEKRRKQMFNIPTWEEREERFAIGAALLFFSMGMISSASPCNDEKRGVWPCQY